MVPFTAGSATDILARIVGDRLAARWSQAVVVENKPGAGGTIGAAVVAKAEPDGYTLAVVSVGHVVNPHIYRDLPYDTISLFGFLNRWNDTLATPLEEEAIEVGERLLARGGWRVGKHQI